MSFLLWTDAGIEDVLADEVRQRWPAAAAEPKPFGGAGLVRVSQIDPPLERWRELSTVHHVVDLRAEGPARTPADVERLMQEAHFPELGSARSFRVSSSRRPAPGFEPLALERTAGAALVRRYGTAVDLEGFEVNVRAELVGEQLLAGIQLTRQSLGKRLVRARALRAALKPTIAAAMVRVAGAHLRPGRLLDPCCGSGTIPIEALRANPALEVRGSDWDEPTVESARLNAERARLTIELHTDDARALDPARIGRFDFIVTDPPYGVRVGRRADLTAFYGALLASFERVLAPGGRIVWLVLKQRSFLRALAPSPFAVVHERLVEAGGLTPRMFVLERRTGAATP